VSTPIEMHKLTKFAGRRDSHPICLSSPKIMVNAGAACCNALSLRAERAECSVLNQAAASAASAARSTQACTLSGECSSIVRLSKKENKLL